MNEKAQEKLLARLQHIRALREDEEAQENDAVLEARALGLSWEAIAQALGRNRSSVWEKYHNETGETTTQLLGKKSR